MEPSLLGVEDLVKHRRTGRTHAERAQALAWIGRMLCIDLLKRSPPQDLTIRHALLESNCLDQPSRLRIETRTRLRWSIRGSDRGHALVLTSRAYRSASRYVGSDAWRSSVSVAHEASRLDHDKPSSTRTTVAFRHPDTSPLAARRWIRNGAGRFGRLGELADLDGRLSE